MHAAAQVPPRRMCPWCGKVSHPSRAAASWRARRESPVAAVRLRVYRCPVARVWHLTSKRPRRRRRPDFRGPGGRRRPLVQFVMFLGCADAGTAEDIAQTAFAEALARAWSRARGHGGSG
jgi:hypothetical protein